MKKFMSVMFWTVIVILFIILLSPWISNVFDLDVVSNAFRSYGDWVDSVFNSFNAADAAG